MSEDAHRSHIDHLDITNRPSDAAGEPVPGSQVRYLPYGEYRTTPTADLTDVGFIGHRDTGLGLIYMRARYYVQSVGRFLSADSIVPDPLNPQSLSRYSYVLGNPLRFSDPSGHADATGHDRSQPGVVAPPTVVIPICVPGGPCIEWTVPSWIPIEYRIGSPGMTVTPMRETIATGMGVIQLGLDALELVASVQGSTAHAILGIGSLGATAAASGVMGPEAGPPTGFAGLLLTWLAGLGPDEFESLIGHFDALLNASGDWVGGLTYYDERRRELVVGQDTLVTFLEQAVDAAFPGCPECDVAINAVATGYDAGKVIGFVPDVVEARIPSLKRGTQNRHVAGQLYLVVCWNPSRETR